MTRAGLAGEREFVGTSVSPPLRVLFHIRHFGVGGIENALIGWLRALDRRHFRVGLSVALHTRELEQVYRDRIPGDVRIHPLVPRSNWLVHLHQQRRDGQLGKSGRLLLGIAMETKGRTLLRRALLELEREYDLIIDFDLTLRKHAAAIRKPLVGFRHFGLWDRLNAKAARVGRAYRHYDCLVVLNEAMRAQALRLYGSSLPRIEVLPNAFDLDAIRAAAHEQVEDAMPGNPYVVCVARLDMPTKGLDTLVHAWHHMQQTHPGAGGLQLVFVGDGNDRARLEALVRDHGLEEQVRFAGLQRNPFPWIGNARLLVLASRTEGMPNVLIEALALNTMTVSTDCPVGPREILADGAAGLLVPVDDVEALAEAIWRAAHDEALRARCLAVAAERARHYGLVASNQRLLALARSLVAGS